MFFSLGKGYGFLEKIPEVKYPLIISSEGVHNITGNSNLDHLVKVVSARLLCHEITKCFPLSILCSSEDSH